MRARWLHSPAFDGLLLIGPPLLAAGAVLALPGLRALETPVWGWVVFVVGVDVAHVYSSLYRTYFDGAEFARRRALYVWTPAVCWLAGVVLYAWGELVFWRVLAYVAVFHFVRQQYGFMRLYAQLQGEPTPLDARIDAAAIYATMLYPLAFWHASADRAFAWFVAGDFIALPMGAARLAGALYAAALLVFAARQAQSAAAGRRVSWGKIGVVASTAAAWYIGIVHLNSDFAFTVTNVVAHGVPYTALIWLYGRRRDDGWLARLHRPAWLPAFVGLLLVLAYVEEGLWDVLVWREHAAVFFGASTPAPELSSAALALLVPLLMLPQAVHYVADGWLWKFDGSNPELRARLLGS